ncbi:hypothetical protein [Escherichia coli]|uniref:hypothetical protein n=1 Tax=Escherichia coli TaxID=562 RepID=UPI001F327CDC|nr:hypothetical protein [Escherichia coli]MCG0061516.1 hypothetical protein [Escherichia coli]
MNKGIFTMLASDTAGMNLIVFPSLKTVYAYSIRGGEISASDGGIAGQNVPENKPPPVSGRAN